MPGGFIGFLMERGKQQEQEEKDRARKFKALVEYGDASGLVPKDKATTMDLDSLEGLLQGYAVKEAMEQAKKKGRADSEIGPALGFYARETAPTTTNDDVGSYYDKTRTEPGGDRIYPSGPPRMDPASAVAAMMERYPNAPASPQFDNVLKLLQYGDTATATKQPEKTFFNRGDADSAFPISKGYRRVVLGPNQATVIPDMDTAGNAVPITGPGGEDLGFGLPNRSGVQPLNTGNVTAKDRFNALSNQKKELIKQKGAVAFSEKLSSAYDAEIAALDAELAALQSGGKPSATGKMTKEKYDKLKSGETYLGNDGKTYRKP